MSDKKLKALRTPPRQAVGFFNYVMAEAVARGHMRERHLHSKLPGTDAEYGALNETNDFMNHRSFSSWAPS
jgi:hypothetical protein